MTVFWCQNHSKECRLFSSSSKVEQGHSAPFFNFEKHFTLLWLGFEGYFPHWINTLCGFKHIPTLPATERVPVITSFGNKSEHIPPLEIENTSVLKDPCSSHILSLFQVHLLLKCSPALAQCQYEPIMPDCSSICIVSGVCKSIWTNLKSIQLWCIPHPALFALQTWMTPQIVWLSEIFFKGWDLHWFADYKQMKPHRLTQNKSFEPCLKTRIETSFLHGIIDNQPEH